jgi:Domain of unknown function (DUF1843)
MPAKKKAVVAPATKRYIKPYKPPNYIIQPLYAVPIYAAVKAGDVAAMKKVAAQARKHVSDITAALAALDKQLGKGKVR